MNNKQHSNYGFVSVCCACARVTSPGETVAGRGVRRSGAERGLELHRFAWRTARRHQGEEDAMHLAANVSVPIDLDEDSFIIDSLEHLKSVHDLIMIPIRVRSVKIEGLLASFDFLQFLFGF